MADAVDTRWLKARMRSLRLNQDGLGKVLGCERSVVSKIINGKQQLRLGQVVPLADALQVSPFEILKRAGFWEGREGAEAQWAALHDQIAPDDRARIIDAVRAWTRPR
jgi:transcriptional regulator with XRE-family HTH domain